MLHICCEELSYFQTNMLGELGREKSAVHTYQNFVFPKARNSVMFPELNFGDLLVPMINLKSIYKTFERC
jgi:hypothetical protein